MTNRRQGWGWRRWTLVGVAAAVILMVGGPFLYIHLVSADAPAPLTLASPSVSTSSAAANASASTGTDGTWKVAAGSIVGYRVKEVLFGQSNVAVGRTSRVSGSLAVDGMTISSARFTVDMTSVTSNESRRDAQFNGRIMQTAMYPTATFVLTKPVDFGSIPSSEKVETFRITGNLTLHGVTRSVTFTATGRYTGSEVQIAGSIPVTFAGYGISNPSFGGLVTTEDHGLLEFSLNLTHA